MGAITAIPNIPHLEGGAGPDEDLGLREHLQDAEKRSDNNPSTAEKRQPIQIVTSDLIRFH